MVRLPRYLSHHLSPLASDPNLSLSFSLSRFRVMPGCRPERAALCDDALLPLLLFGSPSCRSPFGERSQCSDLRPPRWLLRWAEKRARDCRRLLETFRVPVCAQEEIGALRGVCSRTTNSLSPALSLSVFEKCGSAGITAATTPSTTRRTTWSGTRRHRGGEREVCTSGQGG